MEDWDETVSMCVMLKPRIWESEDQPTLVEVPSFGQVKLSEPVEFPFLFTIVDGRREDDISVTGKSRTDPERSSFSSLFETEGCPAPFTLGSGFFCFHCPGMEAADVPRTGYETHGVPALHQSLCSYAEARNVERGSSEKDMENEEKLTVMYEKLRVEVIPRVLSEKF